MSELDGSVRLVNQEVDKRIERHYEGLQGREPIKIDSEWYGKYKKPKRYCVYVLECRGYDSDAYGTDETFKEDWHFWTRDNPEYNEYEPEKWAWAAFFGTCVWYVGYTNNPYRRIREHCGDSERAAFFTKLFPPQYIHELKWYNTEIQAKEAEVETALEMQNTHQGFVYQS